ncbi:hypothetical protein QAD02_001320 [Eretmocerus hayati]|uniref:Uncharacterized protein n=1 Tax=Eretmocerus hayati TaxID=131215 RepID=A0ACC2NHF8_9HYME|nr:hypothetical protein QAD02_001320 [Eretmocerus hayati]
MEKLNPIVELQRFCDGLEDRLMGRTRERKFKIVRTNDSKMILRAEPLRQSLTGEYKNCENMRETQEKFETRRIDNVRIAEQSNELALNKVFTPVPAPAEGVLTGVKPYKPLYADEVGAIYARLEKSYEEHEEDMDIHHAKGTIEITNDNKWNCLKCARIKMSEVLPLEGEVIKVHRVHVVGTGSSLAEKIKMMRCGCNNFILSSSAVWGCEPCMDTFIRHDEDIEDKGIIFRISLVKVNAAIIPIPYLFRPF